MPLPSNPPWFLRFASSRLHPPREGQPNPASAHSGEATVYLWERKSIVHVPTWNSARAYQEAMRSERGVRDQTAPSDHLAWVGPATTPHPRALQSDWLPKRRHSGAAHAAYLHPNLALPLYVVQVRRRSRPRTLRTDLAPLGRYHESRRADCAPYVPHAPPLSHHRSQSGRSRGSSVRMQLGGVSSDGWHRECKPSLWQHPHMAHTG